MEQYIVTGMSCAACQARVEKAVGKVPGVTSCDVSLLTNSMRVEGTASREEIVRAVTEAGYGVRPHEQIVNEREELEDRESPALLKRLVPSLVLLALLMYLSMGHHMWHWPLPEYLEGNVLRMGVTQMLLAAAVMILNHKFFTGGFRALFHGAPNMDSLVALGASVSFGWSVVVFYQMCGGAEELYHTSLYFESAAMIPALITVGKYLEALSKGRTTDALKGLIKLTPSVAHILRDGGEVTVETGQVVPGDLFVVRPGESIPVDGLVEEGNSAVNEAALTGESIPVDKTVGDAVSAGTLNQSGFLQCRATRVGEDTTLSRIIGLVSDAAATKPPIARLADKVSGVFVPTVMVIALLVVLGWLIAGENPGFALARGISVLVISCPCALGLATPVAVMVGNGLGARNGILFKTGEALEMVGRTRVVALDKTGTITMGDPVVTDLWTAPGIKEEELLQKAFALEGKSEHPLAKAIVKAAGERGMEQLRADDFEALPGNGLVATLDGRKVVGGKGEFVKPLLQGESKETPEEAFAAQGKTPLFFAEEGKLLGIIAVADTMEPGAGAAVQELRKLGVKVVMLTGDNEVTARAIGEAAGVDQVYAGLLPQDKEELIRSLQEQGKVAMVGDGINDAPALTRADVGIAIGAGTDVAVDSADVVLVNNRLQDVAAALRLGRGTLRNIRQNLFWAFFYNLICIPLAAGLFALKLSPGIAAAAMSLSSFTVCMNALRLNGLKLHKTNKEKNGGKKMEKTVKIQGMMCAHCEASVKKALEALPQVEEVVVSKDSGTAVVTLNGELDETEVKKAIEEKDFIYLGIE